MNPIEKIIISGDLFRFKNNANLEPFNYVRIIRYFQLLKYQLEKASGKPVEIWNTTAEEVCSDFYDLLGIKVKDQFDWVKIYDLKEIPQNIVEWYGEHIKNSLVIYNEPSKTVKKIHNILGVPYIDMMPHPIRYLDDHLFAVSTNDREIFEYFNSREKKDFDDFYIQAQLIKTQLASPIKNLIPNSALLVGQTEIDKSLIVDGKLKSLNNYYDQIEALQDEHDHIYFTPHPYVSDYKIYNCLRSIKNCSIVKYNTYNLLSQSEIVSIAGISSSSIYEGRFFGKKSIFFQKNYDCMVGSPEFSEKYFFTLGKDEILQPAFWGPIFGNNTLKNIEIPKFPNQIRAALNDYWAFTEYDPSIRTLKRSEYGEKLTKLFRYDVASRITKIEDDINKFTNNRQQQNLACQVNNKTQQDTVKNNENLFILKLLRFVPFGNDLSELVIFKALNDKLNACPPLIGRETKIHCLTYRPRAKNGGRGGAGAVQSAIQQIVGTKCDGIDINYTYSEQDGVWHSEKNKFFTKKRFPKIYNSGTQLMQLWANMVFVFDKARNENAVYITHEIFTAYSLALLKKKYVLVVHSQGSKIHEMTALGERTSPIQKYIIERCEKLALQGAYKVYFPSEGARISYLKDTNYSGTNVCNQPLYNTVYAHPEPVPFSNLERDEEYLTFISVGTLTKSKGQDQTLDYIAKFTKQTNKKVRWICVGRGPLKDLILKKATEYTEKINNFEFIYLEKVPYPSVRYLLSISDIYVMLHRVSIFDLATLEAMENGLMIILSETGGNKEFNVYSNILFEKEKINLTQTLLEDYKHRSIEAFKFFNNDAFKSTYSTVLKDALK